jgi:hypothetical protein
MDNLPRQKLRAILSTHGRAVCKDPERLGALLTKVCPDHPREVQALYHALDGLLADNALASLGEQPWKSVANPVVDDLVTHHSLSEEDADWATTSWGIALGEITPDQPGSGLPSSLPDPAISTSVSEATNHPGSLPFGSAGGATNHSDSPAFGRASGTINRPGSPPSGRNLGLLAALAIGGLVFSLVLLSGVGPLKRGNLFLNQPASYWSQKLQEPTVTREVWQGHVKIMKDVDPAADLKRGQPEAVPVLIELLQDDNAIVRQEAVLILARIGLPAKPAVPALQKAMNDPDEEVRARAVTLLRQLEPAAINQPGAP